MIIEAVNLKTIIAPEEGAVENLIVQSKLTLFKAIVQRHLKTSEPNNFLMPLGQPKTLSDFVGKNKEQDSIFGWPIRLTVAVDLKKSPPCLSWFRMNEPAAKEVGF